MTALGIATHISSGLFLGIVVGIPLVAACRRVPVFDAFVEGAQEGFQITIKLVPYLVGMLVAIGMLRASGAFTMLGHVMAPVLTKIGMPQDVLPLALIRPFSGSAANGMMADIIQRHGGDDFVSKLAAIIMGSTETTFYVVAVYFGSVGIRRTRYAIPAGLTADLVGVLAAVWVAHWLF